MQNSQPSISLLDSIKLRLALSFGFRLLNAFLTRTFFQPDEFYQSWEVAYSDIYGVGFRSWEWQAGIRTSLIPYLFRFIIITAALLGIDHLVLGKIFMAFLASLGDVYTSLLAKSITQRKPPSERLYLSRIAWLLSMLSTFNWYCSTRPFSNSIETALVAVGLYHWHAKSLWENFFAQILAHISIALRPSVSVLWILVGLNSVLTARTWRKRLYTVLFSVLVALASQACIVAVDNIYYGGGALPYVEFFKYNFGVGISKIYGTHPWHWYVSQGIPFILLGFLPFFFLGWTQTPLKIRFLLILNVVLFSAIQHKEFRFLHYLLPIFLVIAALGYQRSHIYLKAAAFFVNIVAAVYFSMYHQRGVMDVVNVIRHSPEISEVSFLMPCHSTPWQAHFQRPFDTDFRPIFLTCDPPWNIPSEGHVDEADRFYNGALAFLRKHPEKLQQNIVVFEPLVPLMGELGYEVTHRFYNGLYNEDSRRQGDVIILRRVRQVQF